MKAGQSFETSGTSRSPTRRHVPEDRNAQQQRCDKSKCRMLRQNVTQHGRQGNIRLQVSASGDNKATGMQL